MNWFFALFFGNDEALDGIIKESPQRDSRNCIQNRSCAKTKIPNVMFWMGFFQTLLAWLLAGLAMPIFIFSIIMGVGDAWFSTLGFCFWACTQVPGGTGVWFGLLKSPRLGIAHLIIVPVACVLIEIGSVVSLVTLTPEFISTSCVAAHAFTNTTCTELAPLSVNSTLWGLVFVIPVVALAAEWFSFRFYKMISLSVKYDRLNEMN